MMDYSVLCIAQVEDIKNITEQIAKQKVPPSVRHILVDTNPAQGIDERRIRIAENHQKLKEAVIDLKPDLVWQIEGDCELPSNCLKRLLEIYDELQGDDFGYISGIQVGRHGLYCLGAWVDFTDTSFKSLDYQKKGIQRVDATGFYCLLAPREVWLSGVAEWHGEPYGPDVVWGLSIKKKKYVDMSLHIGHKVKRGVILPSHVTTCNVEFKLVNDKWEYKQL